MNKLHERLTSFFLAVLIIGSANNFIDFDLPILFIPCFIVALIIGYLSKDYQDASLNGFCYGFAISMSCAVWLLGFDSIFYITFIIFSMLFSSLIGLLGVFAAFIGSKIRQSIF